MSLTAGQRLGPYERLVPRGRDNLISKRSPMRIAALVVFVASVPYLAPAQAPGEGPKTFEAKEILTAAERKGPHHTVDDEVPTKGFYYAFTLDTEFGDLEVVGHALLKKRITETEALVALKEVSKTDVFVEAAGRSLESLGKGVVNVAKDPEGTAKGFGAGVQRFGVNLGRKSKRLAEDVTEDDDREEEKSTGENAEGVANSVLGVNKSARIWAQKLQVDLYPQVEALQGAPGSLAILVRKGLRVDRGHDARVSQDDAVQGTMFLVYRIQSGQFHVHELVAHQGRRGQTRADPVQPDRHLGQAHRQCQEGDGTEENSAEGPTQV